MGNDQDSQRDERFEDDPEPSTATATETEQRSKKAEPKSEDPTGWSLFYKVQSNTNDHVPELEVKDCFDIDAALRQIAEWEGACRGTYRVRPPVTRGFIDRNHTPTVIDHDGNPRRCPRRGTFTISPGAVLRYFGYSHVPGGNPTNLVHRKGVEDPTASRNSSGGNGDDIRTQIADLRREMRAPAPSPDNDLEATRKRLALEAEMRRQQREEEREARRVQREEEAEEEERTRRKRAQEREEEDRKRKIRFEEELAAKRAEAEEQRIKDDAAHRRRLEDQREENLQQLRLAAEERKASGGDQLGIVSQIMDVINDEGGIVGLLRTALGGKQEEDEGLMGMVKKAIDTAKDFAAVAKLGQSAPQLPATPTTPIPPQPIPGLPPGTPFLNIADSASFETIIDEGKLPFVKTPVGWGIRPLPPATDKGLVAVKPELWPALDQELARRKSGKPPTDPQDDEDEDPGFRLATEENIMWWKILEAAAPELVEVVEALVEQIELAIESGVTDHRVILAGMMRVFRTLPPEQQAEIRKRVADASQTKLVVEHLPKLVSAKNRKAASDPGIERTLEEVLTAFRTAVAA